MTAWEITDEIHKYILEQSNYEVVVDPGDIVVIKLNIPDFCGSGDLFGILIKKKLLRSTRCSCQRSEDEREYSASDFAYDIGLYSTLLEIGEWACEAEDDIMKLAPLYPEPYVPTVDEMICQPLNLA